MSRRGLNLKKDRDVTPPKPQHRPGLILPRAAHLCAIQPQDATMPYIKVGQENGADIQIFYKDSGSGQPIVFSHGWPLSADEKITVPVLVMHGDDDQIVPYADSAPLSAKLLKNSTLNTYKGFPHGMPTTEAATINADLLAFVKS
jgi:hypothetical protein